MKIRPAKLPKGVTQEFVDGLNTMSTEHLKAEVVRLQVSNQENEEFKESEAYVKEQERYAESKERFDLIAGPVRDITVAIKNRTKLVIERLKDKGAT